MDIRTSFDSRDDRHTYVRYVFQNLSAFVVNLAPNAGIGNIAKGVPIDPNNEVAICTRQYDDLVCSILRNPVKGIHDLRMVLCRESAPPAIAVKFDNKHAVGISHHLHGAIGTEVVSLMGLHSTLPGLLGFARNDIPDRSFNRIEVPPPLQLSSLSPGAHALPVAWRWRIAEVTKNGLKCSTERGPLSFSSVCPPWVNRVGLTVDRPLPILPSPPISGHSQGRSACLKGAMSGSRERRSKK